MSGGHFRKGEVLEYRHDVEGDMIEEWPDGWFSTIFNLTFHEYRTGVTLDNTPDPPTSPTVASDS